MLTSLTNTALVQLIQFGVICFFVLLSFCIVSVRLKLPKTKVEPLLDFLMVLVILIYGVVLKIFFST